MATAGLASLFLVFDMYHGKTPFSRKNPQTFTDGDAAEVHKAIERGMDWLGESKENKADGYYLYEQAKKAAEPFPVLLFRSFVLVLTPSSRSASAPRYTTSPPTPYPTPPEPPPAAHTA